MLFPFRDLTRTLLRPSPVPSVCAIDLGQEIAQVSSTYGQGDAQTVVRVRGERTTSGPPTQESNI
jgi:hypothetical protein